MVTNTCPSCEHSNPAENKFCTECGTPVPRVCRFCEHSNPAAAQFCNKCGGQLNLLPCPSCGAVVDVAAKSCYQCHSQLGGRSSEVEERRPPPREDSRRIDGTAALAAIEQYYERKPEKQSGKDSPAPSLFTVEVDRPEALESSSSPVEPDRKLPRGPVRLFVGAAILAAIGVLGYHNYRQHSLGDADQFSVEKTEQRGSDGPAGADVIRRDMVADHATTTKAAGSTRPVGGAASPLKTSIAGPAATVANEPRAGEQPAESPEATAFAASSAPPQAIDTSKADATVPPREESCTDKVAALGLCTRIPTVTHLPTSRQKRE